MERNLDVEIVDLQKQVDRLRSEIMSEAKGKTSPLKRERQTQKAKLMQQIGILTEKRDLQRYAEALEKINDLFQNTKRVLILEVNNYRIELDKDFNFMLKFSCKHTRKTHLRELLSYQKSCPNNQVLLTRWTSILSTPTALTTGFSCEECKRAKAKKFALFRRHTPSDTIGTASIALQIL